MAKKKAAAKEVERKVLSNGVILIKYDDGSYALLTPISGQKMPRKFSAGNLRTRMTRTKTTRMKIPTKTTKIPMRKTKTMSLKMTRRMKTPTKTKTARRMRMRMTK